MMKLKIETSANSLEADSARTALRDESTAKTQLSIDAAPFRAVETQEDLSLSARTDVSPELFSFIGASLFQLKQTLDRGVEAISAGEDARRHLRLVACLTPEVNSRIETAGMSGIPSEDLQQVKDLSEELERQFSTGESPNELDKVKMVQSLERVAGTYQRAVDLYPKPPEMFLEAS